MRQLLRALTVAGPGWTLALILGLLLGSGWPALAQVSPASGFLTVRSDGFIYWIENGQRHVVYPTPMTDEQINALSEGVPFNAALQAAPTSPDGEPGQPRGASRSDRLPLGTTGQCTLVRGPGQRTDLQVTVLNVQRSAWDRIRVTHPSNQPPREGYEYILVTINVQYTGGGSDLPVSLDRFDFSMVGADNQLLVPAFVIEPLPLTSQTVFPGAEVTAQIAFQVPRNDADLALVWRYNDERPTWFAVE